MKFANNDVSELGKFFGGNNDGLRNTAIVKSQNHFPATHPVA